MANIYDSEGNLNLQAAARELETTRGITNEVAATRTRDILSVAATIDIAVSLRVLIDLLEDRTRELGHPAPDGDTADGDEQREDTEPVDVLEADAGTPIRTMPPAGIEPRYGVLTGNGGEDQGAPWVGVLFNGGGGTEVRIFAAWLEVVPVAERATIDQAANDDVDRQLDEAAEALRDYDAPAEDDAEVQVIADAVDAGDPAEEPTGRDLVEDIDSDFNAPADALAALQAKKKAAKKGGKK